MACKHLFGKEPKDTEVLDFVNKELSFLVEQNERLLGTVKQKNVHSQIKINPKRMQRKINKEKKKPVVSTKAQLAISEARNTAKQIQRKQTKKQKEELKNQRFLQKRAKKQQKKKGH